MMDRLHVGCIVRVEVKLKNGFEVGSIGKAISIFNSFCLVEICGECVYYAGTDGHLTLIGPKEK